MEQLIQSPEDVFSGSLKLEKILEDVKSIVDPITEENSVLDQIHIEGLMPSQVWGQVKLVIDGVQENILKGKIVELREKYGEESEGEAEGEREDELEGEDEAEDEGEDEHEDDTGDQSDPDVQSDDSEVVEVLHDAPAEEAPVPDEVDYKPEKDVFGLNDGVFSIDAYNDQVKALEGKGALNEEGDDEDIDLFADLSDGSDDEMYYYKDFFRPIVEKRPEETKRSGRKKVRFNEGELDENDYDEAYKEANEDFAGDDHIEEDEKLSSFELQQKKLQEEIASLEAEAVAEKKWTMKGEVSARQRDRDALLDEDLEFERTAKPVPVITQETTETLDELIKRRIKDEQFDEIQKRTISKMTDFKPSQKIEVSEEKSSKSLAEVYEDEYSKEESEVASEELKQAHDEIASLFTKLNHKLDSLCSAHFIPAPAEKLLDVKIQTSTISMEDAQPLTMSTGDTLAPQEVYKLRNKAGKNEVQLRSGVVIAKDELDRGEKQRLRRAKKRKIHNRMKETAEKKQRVVVKQP
ncbi:DEKNAAC101117 [Brettanomyces naardenensis]|uniref:DEKNAAC101117 n=1 Tax=Brettanomyces naardenensis TaxID=13370 RepID=A0A448YHG4_BRENA|nr:DEKNAAC101117 [Brettanomyces naardenensis]